MADEKRHFFILNGQRIQSPGSTITGIQVRLLAQVPAEHGLIVEGRNEEADRLLADTDVVDLSASCPSMFTKPPTAFGIGPHEIG
jgi:hypothetical protein